MGWKDWLGTDWRPFEEAREFARELGPKNGLSSSTQWRRYWETNKKPADVPLRPEAVYAKRGWVSWDDFLGHERAYLAASHPDLSKEWDATRNGDLTPYNVTKGSDRKVWWKCSKDSDHKWLAAISTRSGGNGCPICAGKLATPANSLAGQRPELAEQWHPTRNGDLTPDRVVIGSGRVVWWKCPNGPDHEWKTAVRKRARSSTPSGCPFCSKHSKKLSVTNSLASIYPDVASEWHPTRNEPHTPDDVVAGSQRTVWWKCAKGPDHEWEATIDNRTRGGTSCPYCANQKVSVTNSLASLYPDVAREWHPTKNRDLTPDQVVKGSNKKVWWQCSENSSHEWEVSVSARVQGYGPCPLCDSRWNKVRILNLLSNLRPQLPHLHEKVLYTILQQGGAMPALRAALKGSSPMKVIKDLKENDGRELEWGVQGLSEEEIAAYEDEDRFAELPETRSFENKEWEDVDADSREPLPTLLSPQSLRVLDKATEWACGLDDDAAEYIVSIYVSELWEAYINEGRGRVDELISGSGGQFFTHIKNRFLSELESVNSLVVPDGWSFTVNNELTPPNAMQLHTAWSVKEKRRVGNWSGTGAGKTLSAVLASRVVDARTILIVTNNTTVEGWTKQIKHAYPDSVIYTDVDDGLTLDRSRHNYIVLNYEKFQAPSRNHLVHLLLELGVDFIVFDEVQFVKQRDKKVSNRRETLEALVSALAEKNTDLRVLGMSATPVINNLLEARKLLEIVKGTSFPELDTMATLNNGLAMHRALMLHGFRYRPRYELKMSTKPVPTTRNDLLEELRSVGSDVLSVEQVLLPSKLEALRGYFRKGTVIYTHYVEGMIAPIRHYLENMGFRVGLYTGGDKSGLQLFKDGKADILVGSKPIGTGLDELQYHSNRLIMMCLPWTSAEYEQIIGRIYRQGSAFGEVEIIVPQVILDYKGDMWSWDQGRMALIRYKRTLSDCAVDGYIPETVRISPNELLKRSREALERWIERIDAKGMIAIERERLTVPLPPDIREKVQMRHGDFTTLNNRWSTSRSDTTHERLQKDASQWYLYHTLYREARENWPEQPVERIAERIRVRPDWVVGDFGCGECLLKGALPNNEVIGLDHVGWDESVVECDMSATPLDDNSLDVAVFSLSLMGSNWADYLKEAYRTVKPYGHLFIAEPARKWQDRIGELTDAIEEAGFRLVGDVEQRYDFVYLTAVRV